MHWGISSARCAACSSAGFTNAAVKASKWAATGWKTCGLRSA
uniref:Uncharacterized protein n=1 Tax=Myoviridae sp. ctshb19 TaxID=2825194 RepID=A0A8S5UH62_9CAUD|nr:MAG TPA: hypothetical protein [Myoviridae sp. ctshb19]